MKALLITTDNVKKRGFIQSNVEDSVLKVVIYRVHDSMIEPILGSLLYRRLIDGVYDTMNAGPNPLNDDEQLLIQDYLTDCIVAACDKRAVMHVTKEIRNKGAGTTVDEFLHPLERTSEKQLTDELRADFDVYRTRTICFLRDNYKKYPEYYAEGQPGYCLCNCEVQPDPGKSYRNIHFI